MIDCIDVDGFAVFVASNLVKSLEYVIPNRKRIARVLAVMPVDFEFCQVGDCANEFGDEVATDLEYLVARFRFRLVGVSLIPLSIPDKRNRRIADVLERRRELGL